MKFNPLPWLLILVILVVCWWTRSQLLDSQELAFFCEGGGQTLPCKLRWLIVKIFNSNGVGYLALSLGLLSAITRSGIIGLWVGVIGVAGLLLHDGDHAAFEYAAFGFLLGVLTLARVQLLEYRAKHGNGQQQA